jgi:DNA-binding NarL/FixJ family response regulator
MSSAFAHQTPPVTSAPELRVAIVSADAEGDEVSRCLSDNVRLHGIGAVTWCGIDDLLAEQPDVVILVADFSANGGVATLRRIRREGLRTPVVVVARGATCGTAARQALNAGAEAFVRADESEQALAPALHAVMAGLVCAPREVRRLVAKPTFSHREKEVLELLVAGRTNREIAKRLYLAESTVKSHVASVFAKLGVRSRKDAAALLLDPAEGLMATALPPRLLSAAAPDSSC